MPKRGWSTCIVQEEGKIVRICLGCKQNAYRKPPPNCPEPTHLKLHKSQLNASKKYNLAHPEYARTYAKEYGKAHPEAVKLANYRASLMRKYGLKLEDIDRMLIEQQFACKLCHNPFTSTPFVDHDHKTGRIRGLLCNVCNLGIGWVERFGIKTLIKYILG